MTPVSRGARTAIASSRRSGGSFGRQLLCGALVAVLAAAFGATTPSQSFGAPRHLGGQLIVVANGAVNTLPADGGQLRRLYPVSRGLVPVAASHRGGVIASLDFSHGWGSPDQIAQGIVISDLDGRNRRLIGYGTSVALSADGKWAAITGVDPRCAKLSTRQGNPCDALIVVRTEGSDAHVFDSFRYTAVAWSRDDSQIALVQYVNEKVSKLLFISRDDRSVGRTITVPISSLAIVQQADWTPGRIVLSSSDQGAGGVYDVNTQTGKTWLAGVAGTPRIWLSASGTDAIVGGVYSYSGDPGGIPGGGLFVDALSDFKPHETAANEWIDQKLDEDKIPPLHPLYTSKRLFDVIGWAW